MAFVSREGERTQGKPPGEESGRPSIWPLPIDYATMGQSDIELMSDEEYAARVAHENGEGVTAPCPFCGTDGASWDIEVCLHLLADYWDGTAGDRGILCGPQGSHSGNAALACLAPLEEAWKGFVGLAGPGEDSEVAVDAAYMDSLRTTLYGEGSAPKWWGAVMEVGNFVDSPLGPEARSEVVIEAIFNEVAPWSKDLEATTEESGDTGTAGRGTYVWARNPAAATQAIASAITKVEAEIRSATAQLLSLGWRKQAPEMEPKDAGTVGEDKLG